MCRFRIFSLTLSLIAIFSFSAFSQIDSTFKIFQFPPDKIPRIDGNTDDWIMVPASYIIGNEQLRDDEKKHAVLDTNNLNVKVRVGWVKGMNRLYFLYEAYDNYWDFSRTDFITIFLKSLLMLISQVVRLLNNSIRIPS